MQDSDFTLQKVRTHNAMGVYAKRRGVTLPRFDKKRLTILTSLPASLLS